MKKLIKTGDMILIVFILAISLGLLLIRLPARADTRNVYAEILVDGEVAYEIDLSRLSEERIIRLGSCTICAGHEGVEFIESDCPDQICVQSGQLSRPGDMAACVPNKTMIRIVGSEEMDAVTY